MTRVLCSEVAVRRPQPIRIAFLLHRMQVAGAEMLVAQIIERLGPRLQPLVLCLDGIGALGEQLRARGVPVLALGRRAGRDWRLPWRLKEVLRQHSVELVHAHQYTPFFYGALARLCGAAPRLMLTEHGRHFPDRVSPLRRSVNRLLLDRQADAVNAVSQFSARALHQEDGFRGRRIEVIPNGVELDRFALPQSRGTLRQALGLASDRRYLVCVARFHPVKDHSTLLQAFALLARSSPELDLLLVGDGPLRPVCEAWVARRALASRVRFLGVRDDVAAILRAADVFALTSLCEAAPLTLLEAMATGIPVVATAVGGIPEMIRDGQEGLLRGQGDAGGIAQAVRQILAAPGRGGALAEAARYRVWEHYRLKDTVAAYYDRYRWLTRPSG